MDIQKITLANGCFWCTEAIFQTLKGVKSVTSGYIGGHIKNPTYEQVCTGTSGHAEAIELEYNAEELNLDELLLIFFKTHDPTTLNRQGNDEGPQYRSGIFYHTDEQKEKALATIKTLTDAEVFDNPIVTEVTPASEFYSAEQYHQNYYRQNSSAPYCEIVIDPKLEKVRNKFSKLIKHQIIIN